MFKPQRFRIKTSDLPHCESSYDENQERWLNILQKQSSSAAVIFTPSLLVSPLSPLLPHFSLLASDNYHVNPEPVVTTRKPGNAAAPLTLTAQAPCVQGSILQTAPHTESRWRRILLVLEFLRSRTDLRGQRWSPLSTCTQHVTTHHTCHLGTRQWSQDIWRLNHW